MHLIHGAEILRDNLGLSRSGAAFHRSRDHRIAFDNIGEYMVMFNPVIVKKSAPYDAEEGCLSLTGTRKTKRYQTIKVQWQNEQFQTRIKTFTGWTAQIIQHENDHCEGILI